VNLDDLADAFDRDRADRHRRGTHRWVRLLVTLAGLVVALVAVVTIVLATTGDDDDDDDDDDRDDDSWGPAGSAVVLVLEDAT
jgi:hypothetical protein